LRAHFAVADVATLALRFGLPPDGGGRLFALLDLVASDPLAPTAVREHGAIVNDHLADSLVALDLDAVRGAEAIADLGAGAGFPGLPLAIALPHARVTLVESVRRKCEFIDRAIASAGAANASVVCERAEAWPGGLRQFDLVTARALAPLPIVAEYAAPLLVVGGALVAWRGRVDAVVDAASRRAAAELGLRVLDPIAVTPYPGAKHRHLQLLVKVSETPRRFPRRPGIARKRPLGG